MPLLLKRRSVLDLLNTNTNSEGDGDDRRPRTSSLIPVPPRPGSPRPTSEYGYSRSRLSHEVQREDLPGEEEQNGRAKRFSMLKFRNFSESHLAVRAKEDEKRERENAPPVPVVLAAAAPSVPSIVKTAPTMDHAEQEQQEEEEAERRSRPSYFKRSMSKGRSPSRRSPSRREPRKSVDEKKVEKPKHALRWRRLQGRSTGLEDLQRLSMMHVANNNNTQAAPPSYGDDSNSALALPVSGHRFSESSRSDGSNGSSDQIYGSTTTTTHTVSTHTTFFRLPRRNKNRNSLFPLPVKIPPPHEEQQQQQKEQQQQQQQEQQQDGPATPRASTSAFSARSLSTTPNAKSPPATSLPRRHTESSPIKRRDQQQPPLPANAVLAKQSLTFAEPGMNLFRNESQRSRASSGSSPLQPPMRLGMRDRASTTSSFGRNSHDMGTPPPLTGSGSARNSTSTTGRSSLGGFLNLSRFRQSSDPHSPRHGSSGTGSKSNSFAMSREALVVPEREEGDTPVKYLERLEAAVARSMIAGILSKSAEPFAQAVLRSYTRRFKFFGEPIDMSLRKFLLEAELPKETQQVDRVVQAFADRYHECNPGIFVSSDQAYIIAFSLMMLHTDAFNKNNKRKMQKPDYIKNTSGQQVSDDVLGCFYDNICYTPFVHYEEEVDINGERVLPFKPKKSKLKGAISSESGKKPSGPVDPYNLLVDQKLDMLRPLIKDLIQMDDPYSYRGGQAELDPLYLQRAFTHTGVLQIISQRSRPTAYEGQLTNTNHNIPMNPMDVQPGIIDLKITKVGTLWRKAMKKKKARSPWQEWGAILTGSQLYLFKNAHWAKGLVHQFLAQQKHGHPRIPVVFKPPLQDFKPDALIKTDNAVALVDATYTRHKHAFAFIRPGGQEEFLLADNESELNDWLALINYAAAFRAAGVRIRGMVGGTEEDLRARDVRRLDSTQTSLSTATAQSAGSEPATTQNRGLSPQLQRQVMAARRQIVVQKIGEARKEIVEANKQLDAMLRNARHLLVLAPIAPKTREDVIHAASRAYFTINWTRRDIWRMKCHKDILAMDVQQDGVSAPELEALADQQHSDAPESVKKSKIRGLSRLNSKASAARSPPLSPTSPTRSDRPSTTGSIETYIGNDVFRNPPESATLHRDGDAWRLPPLQLDVRPQEQHRGSVTSTLLTASSPGRASLSHASSASSVRPPPMIEHAITADLSDGTSRGRVTPSPSFEEHDVEMLARTLSSEKMEPMATRPTNMNMNMDGVTATPESTKHRNTVRRSLQKTLPKTHHHPSTVHKHKKGKESDGTIRSGAGAVVEDEEPPAVATPSLQREKPRFILHGKQASVIQFGSEWPNERMRLRREQWRQNSTSPREERTPRAFSYSSQQDFSGLSPRAAGSPVVQDFYHRDDGEGEGESEDERVGSAGTTQMARHSYGFREDAVAAQLFAEATASPEGMTGSEGEFEGSAAGGGGEGAGYFDLGTGFDFEERRRGRAKRETVIGPRSLGGGGVPKGSLRTDGDGNIVTDDDTGGEDDREYDYDGRAMERRGNRQTVIGPNIRVDHGSSLASASGGAEEADNEDGEGDGDGLVDPISDEELRQRSQMGHWA